MMESEEKVNKRCEMGGFGMTITIEEIIPLPSPDTGRAADGFKQYFWRTVGDRN
jgi:hypothetical protein